MSERDIPLYENDFVPGGNGQSGIYTGEPEPPGDIPYPEDDADGWRVILGAPDYTTLVKPKSTATSREYTRKTNSLLKSGVIFCVKSGDMADAATIIHHGPGFSVAMGQLADQDERAKRMLDFLTSPSNPYINALLIGTSLIFQLARNHEKALHDLPDNVRATRRQRKAMRAAQKEAPPRFTMRLLGREIPIRWQPRVKLGALFTGFRGQTHPPDDLTNHVFSDPKLLKALADQGIIVVKTADG